MDSNYDQAYRALDDANQGDSSPNPLLRALTYSILAVVDSLDALSDNVERLQRP